MVLRVGDEKVVFKLHQVMRHSSSEDDTCFSIDATDIFISKCVQEILEKTIGYIIWAKRRLGSEFGGDGGL